MMAAAEYEYPIAECDVIDARALESFRAKRRVWLSWLKTDEHHAILPVLSSLVWADVAFRTLTNVAVNNAESALNNPLLVEALLDGHLATQVLAIRRLVDNDKDDRVSLRRLLKDIKHNFGLFTRENYVCFDGLPYDYETVQRNEMLERAGKGVFWAPPSGPRAWAASEMAHAQFEKFAGIDPAKRQRDDRLPKSLIASIEKWLNESGADEIAKWSHAYLAHAGGPLARARIDHSTITRNKLTAAIRGLARVTEAISAWLVLAGGLGNLMPVAQFNQFEKLAQPIMRPGGENEAYQFWYALSDERDRYLDGLEAELIPRKESR
jgi:hypothetical protein